ncbi:MAG: WYL domain-containing protein [Salinibacterium sp.]|nr:WYL domain-containing protein [Salinibacterium sp.]
MAKPQAPKLAGDKVAFLLSLVPYLIDRDRVTVAEAAAHFGVPEDQLRAAVRLISVSGIPGETATYQHGDLFDISWADFEERDEIMLTHNVAIDESPRFSGREAAALIAGLNYLAALPEYTDSAAGSALMSKLARGASAAPTQLAVEVSQTNATLALIRQSVAAGVQLEFDYLNGRGERETRRVDPLRIDTVDTDWYLRGWCHSREAKRTFRLDRIVNAIVTADAITRRAHDVSLSDRLFEASSDDLVVTLEVASAALPLLAAYEPELADSAPTESGQAHGPMRVTVRVSHFHGLKRLVASMNGAVTVIGPPEARQTVKAWADAALTRYTVL